MTTDEAAALGQAAAGLLCPSETDAPAFLTPLVTLIVVSTAA